MNTVKITEANVSKSVRDVLDAKRIMWFRMNASQQILSYTTKDGEKRNRRIAGQRAGTADLLALVQRNEEPVTFRVDGVWWEFNSLFTPLWIELKAPGKKQSAEQKEFQKDVEERGMTYLLVDDVQTLVDWLKERGL